MTILVFGNPVDGLKHCGPFDNEEQAIRYAVANIDDTWWVADLETPQWEEPS